MLCNTPYMSQAEVRALVGARVSNVQGDEKTSHITQRGKGEAYAESQDWTVVGIPTSGAVERQDLAVLTGGFFVLSVYFLPYLVGGGPLAHGHTEPEGGDDISQQQAHLSARPKQHLGGGHDEQQP